MRWHLLSLAATAMIWGAAAPTWAQADPNQPNIADLIQQVQQNMNAAGVTPQDLAQQARDQMQNGQFDPQAFMQGLQQQGIINQNMLDQIGQMRNQFQQRNQQQQMTNLQQVLNSPDEEWAVLSVKIQRVMDLSSDYNQTTTNTRGAGRLAAAPPSPTAAQGPVGKALADLRTLLQDSAASDAAIHTKLNAYRDARQRVQADLTSARQDLLSLVTLRQEAILLVMDILN